MSANWTKSDLEVMVISLFSAAVHFQEHADTGEALDLVSAKSALSANLLLRDWAQENKVLLPIRRDGLGPLGAPG